MTFFRPIEGAFGLLQSKGVYRQAPLFARANAVYAKWGSGFVRLNAGGATTVPTVKWFEIDAGETATIEGGDRDAPKLTKEEG